MEKNAIFAGGCFWCLEHPFDEIDGVTSVLPGYVGGKAEYANYEKVSMGNSGHREAIQVTYNADKVDYSTLLETFWRNIDPFDPNGQFYDKGEQYTTAIYYNDDAEKKIIEDSVRSHEAKFSKKIATLILPAEIFYVAEEYHQKYYQKNPLRYNAYAIGSGRKDKLKNIWGSEI